MPNHVRFDLGLERYLHRSTTSLQEALIARARGYGAYRYLRIAIDQGHLRGFPFPVVQVTMDDTDGIDSDVSYTERLTYLHRILDDNPIDVGLLSRISRVVVNCEAASLGEPQQ